MYDKLAPPYVLPALETSWVGRTYLYVQETNSTNDLLKQQVAGGETLSPPGGTVLLTDFQERGRGRLGRSWEAPAGSSLLFSILLRPRWGAERLNWLTMISALAVSEAVENLTGLTVGLKWPNDGVVKQQAIWQKYCGILLEGHTTAEAVLDYAIAGIGVNVNIPSDQLPRTSFPATSLLAAGEIEVSRLELFTGILSRFETYYELANNGVSPHEKWQKQLIYRDQQVVVSRPGEDSETTGIAIGTDINGQLLLRDAQGQIHTISAGDVTLREYLNPDPFDVPPV